MSVDDPLSVDELFRDGELRLWEDSEGWSGYLREKLLGVGVWKISVRRGEFE